MKHSASLVPSIVGFLALQSISLFRALAVSVAALICLSPTSGIAQTAHFTGAQTYIAGGGANIFSIAVDAKNDVYFTVQNGYTPMGGGGGSALYARFADNWNELFQVSGFNFPTGLALDSSGNLYVLDSGAGTIDEIVASNGTIPETTTPTIVPVASGIVSQGDLAVDSSEDLFFTSVASSTVNEIASVNGTIPPSPVTRTLGSGFSLPVGIAVDKFGNVYVGDALNHAVKELLAVNGSIPSNPTILTLGSGFVQPEGLALDNSGNVFVSDYGNNSLKEILAVNGAIPPSPVIQNLGSYSATQAVTLDLSGNLYVGDNGISPGFGLGGTVFKVSLAGGSFAPTNVGSSGLVLPMAFTFDSAGTLGSTSVLTRGATGLDFVDAGSGTCKANTAYSAGQTCTVNVQFMPKFADTRNGAVVLYDPSGNPIVTGYIQGTGIGPQAKYLPGTESVIPSSGLSVPIGIAVDGGGNIFVVDNHNGRLIKLAFSNGVYIQSTIATGLLDPYLAAVDGAGNVYVADVGNERVVKETPTASGYAQSIVDSGFGYPYGVAVDGSGRIYIANDLTNGPSQILMETPSVGGYIRSIAVTGLMEPVAVAVDRSGNLYVADPSNHNGPLLKETLTAGGYSQSSIPVNQFSIQSVAVDGLGNVYFADEQTRNIFEEKPTANGYVQSLIVGDLHTIIGPWGLALDSSGNLYIAYTGQNQIIKADFADPPSLNFASTPVGSASTDSPQTVTLTNIGNADLTFPIPASGNNPSVSTNFALDENAPSACPVILSGSSQPGTLASGASCELPISFVPTAAGALNGSLVLTDNNLNAPAPGYTTQSISLSGTATPATPIITWPAPAAISYGTALSSAQLNATSNVPGTFSYSPAAGTVVGAGTHTLSVTFTPTDTADYTTATSTVPIPVTQAVPGITWSTPVPVSYPTALSATQLNATAGVPGTFVYTPAPGTILLPGTQTLSVTFTPADTADYTTATQTVPLTVNTSATTNGLQFIPVTPCRIVDTRNPTGPFGGPRLGGNTTRSFYIPQSACNIPSTAVAYSLNITVVPVAHLGYLTLWPVGQAQPGVSTLNSDGRTKANATIVPAGNNGGVSVYVSDPTHFILDIDGYFVPAGTSSSGLEFFPLAPCRIADTRKPAGPLGGPALSGGTSRSFPVRSSACGIPPTAQAYSLNVTAVPHGPLGWLTAWPTGQTQPVVSTLNSSTGVVTANAAIVPAGTSGAVSIFVSNTADVILDINGYFAPPATGGLSLYVVPSCRIIDTRNKSGAFKGTLAVPVETGSCAPPATAQAYILNATVLPPGFLNYLTLWPDGGAQPLVSTLNSYDGAITSNMAIVPTTNGTVDAFASDSTQLLLDLSAYFAP